MVVCQTENKVRSKDWIVDPVCVRLQVSLLSHCSFCLNSERNVNKRALGAICLMSPVSVRLSSLSLTLFFLLSCSHCFFRLVQLPTTHFLPTLNICQSYPLLSIMHVFFYFCHSLFACKTSHFFMKTACIKNMIWHWLLCAGVVIVMSI